MTNCLRCGKELPPTTSGKPKKFCDYKCKHQYYALRNYRKKNPGFAIVNSSSEPLSDNDKELFELPIGRHEDLLQQHEGHNLRFDRYTFITHGCLDCSTRLSRTRITRIPTRKEIYVRTFVKGKLVLTRFKEMSDKEKQKIDEIIQGKDV